MLEDTNSLDAAQLICLYMLPYNVIATYIAEVVKNKFDFPLKFDLLTVQILRFFKL